MNLYTHGGIAFSMYYPSEAKVTSQDYEKADLIDLPGDQKREFLNGLERARRFQSGHFDRLG